MRNDISLACALVLLFLAGCSEQQPASTELPGETISRPDSESFGTQIELYEGRRVTTRIDAEKIVRYISQDSTMAYTLDIDVFDSIGVHSADIVGDSGIIREKTGNMSLFGHVVVVTADSVRLETDYLFWDDRVDSIKTDAFVRLTRGDDVITGYGMQADQKLQSTKILRHVTGKLADPKTLEKDKL
jgi:LPS export ABC transporter protein LptC